MNGHEIVSRIDDLLWEQRKKKKDLFEDCKITSSAYSQWNTGKSNPSIKKLTEISEYLNTTVEYLVSGIEPSKEKSAAHGGATLHDTAYDKLSDANRAIIDDLIAKLYKAQSDD